MRSGVKLTRGEFLQYAGGFAAAVLGASCLNGNPLGLPIGLQPYTVRDDLKRDFDGTMKQIVAMGYREMEVNGGPAYGDFYGHKPAELKKVLDDLGLGAPSCHHGAPKDDDEWKRNIDAAHQLRLQYMLCGAPPKGADSLDGWKRTSEFFNHLGTLCRDAGMQFAYHNHNFEFRVFDGVVGYDELLRSTDRDLVKMEMDCFWITFAGKDPVAYFDAHPGRFPLLHIKDLKPGYAPTTDGFKGNPFAEVGRGTIDWKRIFANAHTAGVKHYFVEQDMWDRPSLECARISVDYLKKLQV